MEPNREPERRSSTTTLRIIQGVGGFMRRLIFGLPLVGLGSWWIYDEINHTAPGDAIHSTHVFMAAGMILMGGIAIDPPFKKDVTDILVTVSDRWPFSRRAGDIPPSEPPKAP